MAPVSFWGNGDICISCLWFRFNVAFISFMGTPSIVFYWSCVHLCVCGCGCVCLSVCLCSYTCLRLRRYAMKTSGINCEDKWQVDSDIYPPNLPNSSNLKLNHETWLMGMKKIYFPFCRFMIWDVVQMIARRTLCIVFISRCILQSVVYRWCPNSKHIPIKVVHTITFPALIACCLFY